MPKIYAFYFFKADFFGNFFMIFSTKENGKDNKTRIKK